MRHFQYLEPTLALPVEDSASTAEREALAATGVLVKSIMDDVVTAIKEAIKKEIKADEREYAAEQNPLQKVTKLRVEGLKDWTKEQCPLKHGYPTKLLLRAISKESKPARELAFCAARTTSVQAVGQHLWDMGQPGGDVLQAPLFPHSSSSAILPLLVQQITHQFKDNVNKVRPRNVFMWAWQKMPRGRKILSSSKTWILLTKPPTEQEHQDVENGRRAMDDNDDANLSDNDNPMNDDAILAEWSIVNIPIHNLRKYLNSPHIPEEATHEAAMKTIGSAERNKPTYQSIINAYDYVGRHISMSNPLHKLVIFAAAIFITTNPRTSYNPKDKPHDSGARSPEAITRLLRTLPWTIPQNSKGTKGANNRTLYYTTLVYYLISMLDQGSPIHRGLVQSGAQPEAWTHKHNAKSMTALMMVRTGFATAHSYSGMFRGTKYNQAYKFKTLDQYKAMGEELYDNLSSMDPLGPRNAIAMILGENNADEIAEQLHLETLPRPSISAMSSQSQGRDEYDDMWNNHPLAMDSDED
ncbi:hypothetical protein K474DRAFT_1678183 [Panus rudis PR-1116 ss-1]|nr:hypothetical protein K474DRAFT_1678183 [Panus rudis PR-1116 ss-1]